MDTMLLAKRVTQVFERLVQTTKTNNLFARSVSARAQGADMPAMVIYRHDSYMEEMQNGSGLKLLCACLTLKIVEALINAAILQQAGNGA